MTETSDLSALLESAVTMSHYIGELRSGADGNEFFLSPPGWTVNKIAPELRGHVKESVVFEDADSLCVYVKEYCGHEGKTIILASPSNFSVMAVLNYHKPDVSADGTPLGVEVEHADHRARFKPEFSEQYSRWRKIDEVWLPQEAFAAFIEEFCRDISSPPAATMIEVARDIEMAGGALFASRINTQNGQVQIKFIESGEAKTSGGIEIPKQFQISVPIFFGEEVTSIPVFLRFRANKSQPLHFSVKLQDMATLEKKAFLRAVTRIGDVTGIRPLLGSV